MKNVMLAASQLANVHELKYPVLASGKIDGVRVCVQEGKCVAGRSLKPSINKYVMEQLSDPVFEGMDGELTLADESWNDFNANQSAIMTKSGIPKKLVFHVFDSMDERALTKCAQERKEYARQHVESINEAINMPNITIRFCKQFLVHSAEELLRAYEKAREAGYEGLIVCDPKAKYKHGRSTLKQGIMLKLKPCEDDEAELIGFEKVQHNLDAGNSNSIYNKVEGERAGRLIAKWRDRTIHIGPGKLTHNLAEDIAKNFDKYKGRMFTFTYMEIHKSGEPRSARFKGFRSKDDM